jgi:hypothetical protein
MLDSIEPERFPPVLNLQERDDLATRTAEPGIIGQQSVASLISTSRFTHGDAISSGTIVSV